VFFGDVAQQVLFAQQLGWHAFSLGALMRTHGRAERPAGARTIAIASNNASAILPAIAFTVYHKTRRTSSRSTKRRYA
jgi:hypothetical protein